MYECICKQVYFRKSTFDDHIFREHDTKKFPKLAKNSNRCQKCGIVPTTLRLGRLHFYWRHTHRDVDSSKIMKCKMNVVVFPGVYECQISTAPVRSLRFNLQVVGSKDSPSNVVGCGTLNRFYLRKIFDNFDKRILSQDVFV